MKHGDVGGSDSMESNRRDLSARRARRRRRLVAASAFSLAVVAVGAWCFDSPRMRSMVGSTRTVSGDPFPVVSPKAIQADVESESRPDPVRSDDAAAVLAADHFIGRTVDVLSGAGIPGVRVAIARRDTAESIAEATTEPDGSFALPWDRRVELSLIAEHPDYWFASTVIGTRAPAGFDIQMTPYSAKGVDQFGAVEVAVRGIDDPQLAGRLRDVRAFLSSINGYEVSSRTCDLAARAAIDESGVARFPRLPAGLQLTFGVAGNWRPIGRWPSVVVTAGRTLHLDVAVEPGHELHVRFVDRHGALFQEPLLVECFQKSRERFVLRRAPVIGGEVCFRELIDDEFRIEAMGSDVGGLGSRGVRRSEWPAVLREWHAKARVVLGSEPSTTIEVPVDVDSFCDRAPGAVEVIEGRLILPSGEELTKEAIETRFGGDGCRLTAWSRALGGPQRPLDLQMSALGRFVVPAPRPGSDGATHVRFETPCAVISQEVEGDRDFDMIVPISAWQRATGRLSIRLVAGASTTPIERGAVEISSVDASIGRVLRAVSDADGIARFVGLEPGEYRVAASYGWAGMSGRSAVVVSAERDSSKEITIGPGWVLEVCVAPTSAAIDARMLRLSATQAGVEEALSRRLPAVVPDADGRCFLRGLDPDRPAELTVARVVDGAEVEWLAARRVDPGTTSARFAVAPLRTSLRVAVDLSGVEAAAFLVRVVRAADHHSEREIILEGAAASRLVAFEVAPGDYTVEAQPCCEVGGEWLPFGQPVGKAVSVRRGDEPMRAELRVDAPTSR